MKELIGAFGRGTCDCLDLVPTLSNISGDYCTKIKVKDHHPYIRIDDVYYSL